MLIALAVIFTILAIRKEAKNNAIATAEQASLGKNSTVATQVAVTKQASVGQTVLKVFPWFILGFLIMAVLNTVGLFSNIDGLSNLFKTGYKFFITVALAGVGFKIQFKDLFTKGIKPIILGGCTWLAVAAS